MLAALVYRDVWRDADMIEMLKARRDLKEFFLDVFMDAAGPANHN